MQQLQLPEVKLPELERSPVEPDFDRLTRAKQGETAAIASLLSQKLNPIGITVQSHRKGDRVAILVESTPTPQPQSLLNWLHRELTALQPDGIHKVAVYGRATGKRVPEWQETLEIQAEFTTEALAEADCLQLSDWLRQGSDRGAAALPRSAPRAAIAQPEVELTPFLRFYLNASELALLPLEGIQEVLKIPATAILPVPQMPSSVLGVYNCRGTILWLVDLEQQVGLGHASGSELHRFARSPWQMSLKGSIRTTATHRLTVIVVEIEQQKLGFVVPKVLEIEYHNLQNVQSPVANLFSPTLLPFIQGWLPRSSSPVLSLAALVHDPALQIYRQ